MHGERYGRLTVIGPAEKGRHGHRQVECRCDCGRVLITRAESLTHGLTRSCGCIGRERMESMAHRLEGQRFGRLTAVSRVPFFGWTCRCDCGGETTALSTQLRRGEIRSCGSTPCRRILIKATRAAVTAPCATP